jgi:hypothetical protein
MMPFSSSKGRMGAKPGVADSQVPAAIFMRGRQKCTATAKSDYLP